MPEDETAFDRRTVAETSRRIGGLLRATRDARVDDGLTAEELLIYLAIGHLGVDAGGAIPKVTPRTHLEIAQFLGIPRETVRRKVGRLGDRGYAQITSAGVVVRDVAEWARCAAALFPSVEEAGARASTRRETVETPALQIRDTSAN